METYTKQFDKMTRLYIAGKVQPLNADECFAGDVLDNGREWFQMVHSKNFSHLDQYRPRFLNFYSIDDMRRMEKAFMNEISIGLWLVKWVPGMKKRYEDHVFNAFCKGLEELKRIHEEKGEVIGPKVFKSRSNVTTKSSVVIA